MEFQAALVDGVLKILPNIVSTPNEQGGNNVVVHALTTQIEKQLKEQVVLKMAAGEKVNLKIIQNGVTLVESMEVSS